MFAGEKVAVVPGRARTVEAPEGTASRSAASTCHIAVMHGINPTPNVMHSFHGKGRGITGTNPTPPFRYRVKYSGFIG